MPPTMKEKIKRILRRLTAEETRLLEAVLKAERSKLHLSRPHGINQLLREAVEDTII